MEFLPEAYAIKSQEQEEATALLLGRASYEAFSPVWPGMEEFTGYKAMPKYVVSTKLTEGDLVADWGETTILRSLDEVAALKETEGGPIIVHGSTELNRNLADADLIDRYHLLVFPLLLGGRQAPVQRHGQGRPEAEARRARGVRQRHPEERLRGRPLTRPEGATPRMRPDRRPRPRPAGQPARTPRRTASATSADTTPVVSTTRASRRSHGRARS